MNCPYCGSQDTHTLDSRKYSSYTRRRKECEKCKEKFTTLEAVHKANPEGQKGAGSQKKYLIDHTHLQAKINVIEETAKSMCLMMEDLHQMIKETKL